MLGEENPLLPLRRRFLGPLVQPDRGARRIRDLAPRPLYLQKFNRCHLLLLYHKPANGNRHKYEWCFATTPTPPLGSDPHPLLGSAYAIRRSPALGDSDRKSVV